MCIQYNKVHINTRRSIKSTEDSTNLFPLWFPLVKLCREKSISYCKQCNMHRVYTTVKPVFNQGQGQGPRPL